MRRTLSADQRAGERREGYVLPFRFSVDVQREVLCRDWIREMNTIESRDSLAPKLKGKLKSRGTETRRIWSGRMSWFVTVSSSCLGIGCLFFWPCLAATKTCEGQLPNRNRQSFWCFWKEGFFCLPVISSIVADHLKFVWKHRFNFSFYASFE